MGGPMPWASVWPQAVTATLAEALFLSAREARYRSASSAARQPEPAAVMA